MSQNLDTMRSGDHSQRHLPQQHRLRQPLLSQSASPYACNEEKLVSLSDRTGYQLLQENGQRKYGPPPNWEGPPPEKGCEVFVGKIPRDCFEDELVPLFETIGKIYELRLMMDFSGSNRGYAFVMFTSMDDAREAIRELDGREVRPNKKLGVVKSVDNCRLFVGGIPKQANRKEVKEELANVTDGVTDVILYSSPRDQSRNRGFAFVEYCSHRAAAMARRKLIPGRILLWGQQLMVDWAEPEPMVDDDTMSKVKVLYVRNVSESTSEESLREFFWHMDCTGIEKVKKLRGFAFVHFSTRLDAERALRLNGSTLDGVNLEVTWAKPAGNLHFSPNRGRLGGFGGPFGQHPFAPTISGDHHRFSTMNSESLSNPDLGRGSTNFASFSRQRNRIYGGFRHSQALSDLCRRCGWPDPIYQLSSHSLPPAESAGSENVNQVQQMYHYQVSIPSVGHFEVPQRYFESCEEAKQFAAQSAFESLEESLYRNSKSPERVGNTHRSDQHGGRGGSGGLGNYWPGKFGFSPSPTKKGMTNKSGAWNMNVSTPSLSTSPASIMSSPSCVPSTPPLSMPSDEGRMISSRAVPPSPGGSPYYAGLSPLLVTSSPAFTNYAPNQGAVYNPCSVGEDYDASSPLPVPGHQRVVYYGYYQPPATCE